MKKFFTLILLFSLASSIFAFSKKAKDIKELLPKAEFEFPKGGEALKEKVEIKIEVPEGESAEFYLRRVESLTENYIGKAEKKEGKFEIEIDTKNIPNGEYYLSAKIDTSFGSYQTEEIFVKVENEIKREPEKVEKIEKELKEKAKALSQKEEEIEKITKETMEKIAQCLEEVTEKVKEKLPEKEKKEVEKEAEKIKVKTSSLVKDYKDEVKKEVKVEKELKPEEAEKKKREIEKEKVEIKEETIQQGKKLIQAVKEKISQEEAKAIEREIEKKIEISLKESEIALKEKIKEMEKISKLTLEDSDKDGLSEWEEIRIGTDPFNPDTDNDGYLDGIEFKAGFDPKKTGPADKIFYQDPRKYGKITENLSVERVEIIELEGGEKGLKILGRGIPNSFVTIYIFSIPIIAMAKVGDNGYFEYILDKTLVDGTHTVYVAYTNNKGEIVEKSSPFLFLKSGDKILRITELQAEVPKSPAEALGKSFLIFLLSLIFFSLSLAFFIIGILLRKRAEVK